VTAQPVDWSSVTASFSRSPNGAPLTRSFLSLHSNTMLSDRMTLNLSFRRIAAP
jgi:hypothetical protein